MELRLYCINPSIDIIPWLDLVSNNQEIWGVLFITMWERSADQHDRYKIAEISVGMRPAIERRRYNV